MVVPWLENSAWKYAKVGKQVAAHDFCKWLIVKVKRYFTTESTEDTEKVKGIDTE